MANDDMHVVMYKILAYIYSCNKEGKTPRKSEIMHNGSLAPVPYSYWVTIMEQIVKKGLVTGITVQDAWGGVLIDINEPAMTLEGVEFLQENSMMKKALEFLKETKSALPFI